MTTVISSRFSVIGLRLTGFQSIGQKLANRKLTNRKQKTENRKPITGQLFSVPISITSKSQALALVEEWLRAFSLQPSAFSLKIITTPNPEMIVAAQTDPEFLKALQSTDLAIPDGVGIVWALKCLSLRGLRRGGGRGNLFKSDSHAPIPSGLGMTDMQISNLSRLSGLDLMESLIRESAKHGWRVMLVGGKPGVGEKAAEKLMHQIRPGLAPQGRAFIQSINGPPDIDKANPAQLNSLISSINSYSPDLLFVAFGHGKQEKWLTKNRHRLNAGVAMGVGGALDQIADPSLRPPAYINSIGLGWLYRLFREPRRWKRQLALVKFAGMVSIRALKH